jgi:alkaline phosphatase
MRFAIINDSHLGPPESGYFKGVQRKLVTHSERLIKAFVEEMNRKEKPAFVINLGDSIEDVNDRSTDIVYFKRVIELLSELTMPVYYLIGNHDVRTLSEADVAGLVGHERMYYSFDSGGYHFAVLSFEMTGNHTQDLYDIAAMVPKSQLDWLKDDLSSTGKPTVVFIHYGLADDDMKGNFWFSHQSPRATITNRREVRKILEKSGKVRGVITAHQHWNRMFVHGGIPYFTVTSLIENTKNDGVPAEAYTIVTLNDKKIEVDVRGNDPAKYEYLTS